MEKIRIAIVGAGGMADYHYKGFTNAGANVVAICDQNFERAESYAEKNGIPSCYSSLTELLRKSSNSIDAVSIITPNKFHCPLVLEALQAGKHVYCEKPPALNAHEMAEMKKHAEERKADKIESPHASTASILRKKNVNIFYLRYCINIQSGRAQQQHADDSAR